MSVDPKIAKRVNLNNASLASIGAFLPNSEANVIHNISADLRSQGKQELQMRLTRMKRLQSLEWGFLLDDPEQRYIIGDAREGQKIGPSYADREHFLNSIGVETFEISSFEEAILKEVLDSLGKKMDPLTSAQRSQLYPQVEEVDNQLFVLAKTLPFFDFLKFWLRDSQRRDIIVEKREKMTITSRFVERLSEYDVSGLYTRNNDSVFTFLISIFLRDNYLSGNYDNIDFNDFREAAGALTNIQVATYCSLGADLFSSYYDKSFISIVIDGLFYYSVNPQYFSIIANHLGPDISGISEDFKQNGPFHLIPLLIQGGYLSNYHFSQTITYTKTDDNPFGGNYGFICEDRRDYWKFFQALFAMIMYLMKKYNFTDDDLEREMDSYIENPAVRIGSSMRDSLWKAAYYTSRGFAHLSFDKLKKIVFPRTDDTACIMTGYSFRDEEILDENGDIVDGGHPYETFIQRQK